jgi:UTP:GlnB (protein PII) uridylyltransferase
MRVAMSLMSRVQFEQKGTELTGVEIVRGTRAPLIARLHRTLLALGIVISSYQIRTDSVEVTERIVLERQDGGAIEAQLSDDTKAAILRLAIEG